MDAFSKILATVAIVGFAIQQVLEILDPLISAVVKKIRGWLGNPVKSDEDLSQSKKSPMAVLAFLLGLCTVYFTKISLLAFVDPTWKGGPVDLVVSALVLGAGTEGLNTLTKYFGYVKEGRKASFTPAVDVSIIPSTAKVKIGQSFQFRSAVKNTENTAVKWEVPQATGGSIDKTGRYTAPQAAGTYQVVARSVADEAKHAVVAVEVST